MLNLPPRWTMDELWSADLGRVGVWASPSLVVRTDEALPWPRLALADAVAGDWDGLVVVGGGTMIDEAKAALRDADRKRTLVVVPSLWGSGAEASPVVVLNRNGAKQIRVDAKYLPDFRATWPELAATVPAQRAREACGDCWAHALEGFLSPMASDDLRRDLSELLREMIAAPLANDPCWFELSARACAGQAASGVGLVHGVAHALEHALSAAYPDESWHHAKICATMLLPVMQFNRDTSEKWECLTKAWQLDGEAIVAVLRNLHDASAYERIVPVMAEKWMSVLRDPCSRMNGALVRPQSLEYFRTWRAETAPLSLLKEGQGVRA